MNNDTILAIAGEEQERWHSVHTSIIERGKLSSRHMENDTRTARELTAEMVNAAQDEDRSALASDEAVAHGLSKLRRNITEDLDALAKQPYFARVVTDEAGKSVEFRLGTASFPAQRIIDWRKAPISRLYYNYREGDEFDEIIQGREREGVIKVRRAYQGIENRLNVIELPSGNIVRDNGSWRYDGTQLTFSRQSSHDGHLPPILSLITSEQFGLITKDAKRPIVIQGIAGSGKTTVALHRLAWLLHEDNSDAKPEKCMVVVFNRSLKAYIETTLPELGVDGVNIKTYGQWIHAVAIGIAGEMPHGSFKKCRDGEQFKSSYECLREMNEYVQGCAHPSGGGFIDDLFSFYSYLSKKEIMWPRWELIRSHLRERAEARTTDAQDETVLLNLVYAREGRYPCCDPAALFICDHIVIDEAQDFGVAEIRALLNALGNERTVTIVGDAAQKIVMNRRFGGWEGLLRDAGFSHTTPIELTVSHRTTQEILDVAAHIQNDLSIAAKQGAAVRRGRKPRMIRAESYETQPHIIGKWIEERTTEDPRSLTAVICRLPEQAHRLTEALRKIGYPFVRWAHRENFDFSPGVSITNVHQVKGLEFRNVLIVNPTEEQYSSQNEEERNLLYVAVTRAEAGCDFVIKGAPTSLLPSLAKE